MNDEKKALAAQSPMGVGVIDPAGASPRPTGIDGTMAQMALLMQSMADTIRSTNERLTSLEKIVRQMAPVTSSQAEAIGKAIRDRAIELAERAGLAARPAAMREIGNLIRKDLRLASGIRSVKELPRVEYLVALERIGYWDDYKLLKAVREKYRQEGHSS